MEVENLGGAIHKDATTNADGIVGTVTPAPISAKRHNLDHPKKATPMKRMIWFLMIFCSCSSSNKVLVTEKNDYISYHGSVYIQTHVDKDIRKINPNSDNRITIENKENDTIYVFSTVITNKNMFYSSNNIEVGKKTVLINSYYKNFMKDAPHSGIRKFSFIQLSPMDSLTINVDERKIKQIGENKPTTIKFTYYYFKKWKNFSGDGLINLDKINIRKRSLSVQLL